MKRCSFCLVVLWGAWGCPFVSAQEMVQAPFGPNGTWNIYELAEEFFTWAEALEDARSRTREGVAGDLASIHSLEENQLITDLAFNQIVWIGATDREGTAPLVEQNGHLSPQESIQLELEEFLGAENVEAAKFAGWAWTSGEPFCFHNWAGGEPNNWDGAAAGEADTGFEDAAFIRADGLWNDAPGGYAENEPVAPTLQPGTSTEELDGLPNERLYDYVIEYRTNSPTPFPGIDQIDEEPFLEPGCEPIPLVDPYDFDGDGSIGLGDVNLLLGEVASGNNNASYDLTGDGFVDSADIRFFIGDPSILNTYIGDANLDGEFNTNDLVSVLASGKYEADVDSGWHEGDFNGDLRSNTNDLVAALADGGYEQGPKAAVSSVPEPASCVMLILGIAVLAVRRQA